MGTSFFVLFIVLCKYVCIYVCVCVCMCMYMYICLCIYIGICIWFSEISFFVKLYVRALISLIASASTLSVSHFLLLLNFDFCIFC